MHFPKYEQLVP